MTSACHLRWWRTENDVSNTVREDQDRDRPSKKEELKVFLMLTVLLAPVVSVAVVGGYGFLVWMYQLIYGPPSV